MKPGEGPLLERLGLAPVHTRDARGVRVRLYNPGVPRPRRLARPDDSRDAAWDAVDEQERRNIRSQISAAWLIGAVLVAFMLLTIPARGWQWRDLLPALAIAVILGAAFLSWHNLRRARTRALTDSFVARGLCASCGYPLHGLDPDPDGCTVCPECGGAWGGSDAATERRSDRGCASGATTRP